jgi:precorrin-2 dehydrogenase/sirohydrochlorin ferrochelatase
VNFRFPVFLDLSGKKCLVTGEGLEVPAKVQALVDASANVTYVNPSAGPMIETLAAAGLIEWKQRNFQAGDLTDCFLAITDHDDNSEIFQLAEEQRVLCNAVDDPKNCRFSFGSVHRQGDLTIAISTNGSAPALAVRLREWLQHEVGPEYGALLALLKEVRQQITERIPEFDARRELWYRIVDSDVLALLREGRTEQVYAEIHDMIEDAIQSVMLASASAGAGDL